MLTLSQCCSKISGLELHSHQDKTCTFRPTLRFVVFLRVAAATNKSGQHFQVYFLISSIWLLPFLSIWSQNCLCVPREVGTKSKCKVSGIFFPLILFHNVGFSYIRNLETELGKPNFYSVQSHPLLPHVDNFYFLNLFWSMFGQLSCILLEINFALHLNHPDFMS